jgi:hypothetical protein
MYILLDRSQEAQYWNGTQFVSTQGNAPIGQQYSELVQVVELTNINNVSDLPLRVKVRRAMNQRNSDGSRITGTPAGLPGDVTNSGYKFMRTDHPDNTVLIRYNLAENVSFIDDVGGIPSATSGTSADINTGDFSGSVLVGDILRFTDSELAFITGINTTSPQRFVITDGNDANPVEQFVVDSTNGNTSILGDVTVFKNFTLSGSTTAGSQKLIITNGASTPITKFEVDSATGTVCLKGDLKAGGDNCDRLTVIGSTGNTTLLGGNFVIRNSDATVDKLILQNSTGNLTLSGIITTQGAGTSTIGGPLKVNGGTFTVNKIDQSPEWQANTNYLNGSTIFFGDNIYTVVTVGGVASGLSGTVAPIHTSGTQNNGAIQLTFLKTKSEEQIFQIETDGSMNFAGQQGFYTPTGARKWQFVGAGESQFEVVSNINYFVSPSSDLTLLLPQNPTTGDMIRIVDVGGNLTYNVSLRLRAPNGISVQADNTNANIPNLASINYNGGELVVQTPNAGLGLIYLGNTNYDGTSTGAPSSTQGWWLVEI